MVVPTYYEFRDTLLNSFGKTFDKYLEDGVFTKENLQNDFTNEFSKVQVKMFQAHKYNANLKCDFELYPTERHYYRILIEFLIDIASVYHSDGFITTHTAIHIIDNLREFKITFYR